MNSSNVFYHGNWAWVGFEKLPIWAFQAQKPCLWRFDLSPRLLCTNISTFWVRVPSNFYQHHYRPIWQKPKSKKPGVFVVLFTLQEKPITFGGFGTKSACAKKPESHTDVLVSGAYARLLSTFDHTRVVRITSRAAVGWFRWRSGTTWQKTRIIPCEIGAGVYIGKKPVKFRRSFKKSRCGGGFFDSGFLECLGEVA